nr:monocarboxylate transporter 13-like [Megalopta genalis]XP_033330744.1 monocarboxylate transporter 13-like [Megalopta genalis]XP_033330745.1 monocarboxylate transporter 13-like [Megalopta genalis]XP_033330746.1 monocarboxylate transporter 13-like [Megalopta genalis]XP_033330747.1 monocarboxylate transporter 13-like [Megalopta genalis]
MPAKQNGPELEENGKRAKEQKEDDQDPSENFDPPDGGWGWIIVIAAGFSNFCILPMLQSFGLIFRDRFAELGISTSQTTTIININCAVTACTGLFNGPLFRKFSFRQVAFAGALICAISITILSTMKSFVGAIVFFSFLYGVGIGIALSANALALNTYFKKKRRIATGFSWTCTGLGPIIIPQIITLLMPVYDVEGTTLIIGGVTFNGVACALLLQPVSRHLKKKRITDQSNAIDDVESEEPFTYTKVETEPPVENKDNTWESEASENIDDNDRSSYGALSLAKEKFSSQYLYYDDAEDGASGIDVMAPGVLMMSRANDGWYSRKNTSTTSVASRVSKKEELYKCPHRKMSLPMSRQSSLPRGSSIKSINRQYSENDALRKRMSGYQSNAPSLIIVNKFNEKSDDCKDPLNNRLVEQTTVIPEEAESYQLINHEHVEEEQKSFWQKLIIFFDLDLLRDSIYVNLMMGLTLATFTELNFSLLTPFILAEYGYSKIQVATFMSILAGVDVLTRLTIPFIANLIGWSNRTFFLVGVCQMAVGRIVLAHVQDFQVSLAIAVLLGIGKGLRTIFMALVIPSHVPLSRLPGATGIQLVTSGIVALILGPITGYIRDITSDYTITLHCLNIPTFYTTISWCVEMCFVKQKSKKAAQEKDTSKITVPV